MGPKKGKKDKKKAEETAPIEESGNYNDWFLNPHDLSDY